MISELIDQDRAERVLGYIKEAKKIVVVSHTAPDGDAVGSSLGVFHLLKSLDKEVKVVLPDRFSDSFYFLKGTESILFYEDDGSEMIDFVTSADLIIALDFNDWKRVGRFQEMIDRSNAFKIMIDHHPYPQEEAFDLLLSYPVCSSTAELVFRWISQNNLLDTLTLAAAEALMTGLMTDTGNFSYSCNRPDVFLIAAELIAKGVDRENIYQKVMMNNTFDRMQLMGHVLSENMELIGWQEVALLWLTEKDKERFRYQIGDAEGFVNLPLSISQVRLSIFVREEKGKVKLSFRSKGDFPANKIASDYFNGGGHLNAAGGEFKGSLREALQKVKEVIATIEN